MMCGNTLAPSVDQAIISVAGDLSAQINLALQADGSFAGKPTQKIVTNQKLPGGIIKVSSISCVVY